ncbi:MAG: alpha-L-arabinofuranosidase C-terminal domain-containing protein [Chloroflexota bacterium]
MIKIDPARVVGRVDRRIFGGFIEHLGRCIYGGIYEEGSPLSDEHGHRRDVFDAIDAVKMPILRWPGGNFVSGYHWLDGVGPVDQRPRKIELAWGFEESNRFGTAELIRYCRMLGTEPYICINMGTGTMDEAQAWVEYCNGTTNTHWANLRRSHGFPEPFGVKYWGLGNESYGTWQIGAMTPHEYARKAREYAKLMKLTDPSIELVSCGLDGLSTWDQIVIDSLIDLIDHHSIHIYTGSADYYSNVFAPHTADRALRVCRAMIERARYEKKIARPVYIAYDEWNVWYRERSEAARRRGIEEIYDLSDALAVASYLNTFLRHCAAVKIANIAQLVNAIGTIFTRPDGMFLQTIYHPYLLYARHTQPVVLDPWVDGPTYALDPATETSPRPHRVADLGPFQLLDVTATRSEDGREYTVTVVNRDRDHAVPATLQIEGADRFATASVYEVNGDDPSTVNSFSQPTAVDVREKILTVGSLPLTYAFPAHSVTVLRLVIQ